MEFSFREAPSKLGTRAPVARGSARKASVNMRDEARRNEEREEPHRGAA